MFATNFSEILIEILRNKIQWNFDRNSNIFIRENTFQNIVYELMVILSQPQCVKDYALR